jgi:hypothetical protein
MATEEDLMRKLMISKKIMDAHNNTPRGQVSGNYPSTPELQEFQAPQASYNIPQDIMMESSAPQQPQQFGNSKDRILASKLPDEIKRLMIEHPISQPSNMGGGGSVLSNELVEKAARLMKNDVANNTNPYQPKKQSIQEYSRPQDTNSSLDRDTLKEVIKEVLSENGLLVESTSKSNDMFQFRVGSHIFEGKVTKIKKVR